MFLIIFKKFLCKILFLFKTRSIKNFISDPPFLWVCSFVASTNHIHVTGFLAFKFFFISASLVCITFRQDLTCHPQVPLVSSLQLVMNTSISYLFLLKCMEWDIYVAVINFKFATRYNVIMSQLVTVPVKMCTMGCLLCCC